MNDLTHNIVLAAALHFVVIGRTGRKSLSGLHRKKIRLATFGWIVFVDIFGASYECLFRFINNSSNGTYLSVKILLH